MDKWIELVKAKLRELKLTQEKLAERVGASQGGVGHWLNKRRAPDLKTMNAVLQVLGLEHLEVAIVIRERNHTRSQEVTYETTSAFRYPVSNWTAAAQIGEQPQRLYPDTAFELTHYYSKGSAYWLQVTGDAMTAPVGLSVPQGMLILVDSELEATPGKLVIACTSDTVPATFRQLIEDGGQRYLKPLNPTYPKILCDEHCRILGVVVQAIIKF